MVYSWKKSFKISSIYLWRVFFFDETWICLFLNLHDFICLTFHHQFFISTCCSLIEEGGDWDRRNRLKVYQGTYCIVIRDFKAAANFFLDTISTFTSYELMDYETFVRYTVYISMISLPRNELRDKVIQYFQQNNAAYMNNQNKYYCILGTVLTFLLVALYITVQNVYF